MEPMIESLYNTFLKYPVVTTDSRTIPENSIFFALKGDKFNGNKFALEALKKGAKLAVVDAPISSNDNRLIHVKSVLKTLQNLARVHRQQLGLKVIGITGTNGKTTTKELIQCVLKKEFNSYATTGNLNNHIGVPLTLLSLTKEHEIAVVEMGANHVGEIAELCGIALPDYGIITNIGKAHLEGFGGYEGVIKAKTELYTYIKTTGGKIFINSDNQLLLEHAGGIETVSYGEKRPANCLGTIVESFPFLKLKCTAKDETFNIKSQLTGKYNFENILASVCIGNYFKVSTSDIQQAIESYQPTNNRSQILRTKNNMLIMDAYNANPSSMRAAIENFSDSNFENKIIILGDMAELGAESLTEHKAILEFIKSKTFNQVILIGPEFARANQFFKYASFKQMDKLKNFIEKSQFKNASILIKGSRRMQLEQIEPML